jgi:hypothetical protein
LRWLIEEGYEVVCFLANVGQDEPWDEVEKKALKIGAEKMVRAPSPHSSNSASISGAIVEPQVLHSLNKS